MLRALRDIAVRLCFFGAYKGEQIGANCARARSCFRFERGSFCRSGKCDWITLYLENGAWSHFPYSVTLYVKYVKGSAVSLSPTKIWKV